MTFLEAYNKAMSLGVGNKFMKTYYETLKNGSSVEMAKEIAIEFLNTSPSQEESQSARIAYEMAYKRSKEAGDDEFCARKKALENSLSVNKKRYNQ